MNYSFDSFPCFEAKNIRLRKLKPEDADSMLKYFSDKQVTKYLPEDAQKKEIDEIKDLINNVNEGFKKRNKIRWGIADKRKSKVIGDGGYYKIDKKNNIGKISYRLSKNYWGRGIMSKSLRYIIKFGFESLNLNRIEASVIPANEGSIRLLNKIGFINEGVLRQALYKDNKYYDLAVYAILSNDYFNKNL